MTQPSRLSNVFDAPPTAAHGGLVFLSHNARDKPEVEAIAHWMLDRGFRPWLDKWELRAGSAWQAGLEDALRESVAVLVCVGPHGIGNVQRPEIDVALDAAYRDPNRIVIPVLLPNCGPDLPQGLEFLKQRTWVDLRKAAPEAYDQLALALRGMALGAPQRGNDVCPFRGLEAFEEAHAKWFFGRERETAECLQALRQRRLLAIVGASGSGKSSLVRAGLIPAIRTGQLDQSYQWHPIVLRPGELPVRELALSLAPLLTRRRWTVEELCRELTKQAFLADELDLEAASSQESRRFLLFVDQFEEIFGADVDPQHRTAFVDALLQCTSLRDGRTSVVLTMRADFMELALRHEALATALNGAVYLLGPMREAGLREAVRHPSRLAGLRVDEGLEELLIGSLLAEGMAAEAGDLPLLQFGLEE